VATPTASDPKYAVNVEASNLFKFLTATFAQMPRPVQVIGWLVFLLLFVYLVLYPMLGVTYYEGKIKRLALDPKTGNPALPAPEANFIVKKGSSVVTNTDGEFTFAGHWPYIPFTSVKFWIEFPGVVKEEVAIPAPRPLISLFNPNLRELFYVPSSTARDANNLPQYFFQDLKTAVDALEKSKEGATSPSTPAASAAPIHRSLLSVFPVAYAAVVPLSGRNYTVRLREARVSGIGRTAQVYLDIRIDGQAFSAPQLPDATTAESRDLTVFADTPVRFDSLYFRCRNGPAGLIFR
jgi:hypothetical protein